MARPQRRTLDFRSISRIVNLPIAVADGQPVVYEQLQSAINGLAWKDNVRVSTQGNINLASPGATIDSVSMVSGDAFLARVQDDATENGIYIWNGASSAATRRADSADFDELENAVVSVDEGTDAGTTWRQTQVNGTIDTDDVIWDVFGTAAPAASETTAGVIEIATQTEVNTGTDAVRAVTPATLAGWTGGALRYATTIGDNSNTSFAVTHNLGTRDVIIGVYLAASTYDEVDCEVQRTDSNTVTVVFDDAPTTNELRVVVLG